MHAKMSRFFRFVPVLVAFGAGTLLTLTLPAVAQPGGAPGAASALPTAANNGAVTTVVVQGGSRSLFKIAVPPPLGEGAQANQVVDTATRDFTLSSMFQVLDPKSFTANLAQEGSGIEPSSWRNIGAEGVVKGNLSARGSQTHVELRLYVVSRGSDPV